MNPGTDAVFVPADYDGDGYTDFAVKGSNGIWYIDVKNCSRPGAPETNCWNYIDDDLDGLVNDGCPAVGAAESESFLLDPDHAHDPATLTSLACDPPYATVADEYNEPKLAADDAAFDGYLNDGCPANRQCLNPDGFGGRWDFAYPGYGNATAIPVPADYGSLAGPPDGKADLAVKDSTGFWGIDYADNGFGTWDVQLTNHGDASAKPFAADFDGDGRADIAVWTTNNGTTYGQWYFDYSSDGFGSWDVPCANSCPCVAQPGGGYVGGYGSSQDMPAVGDFNGDGCADISVKTTAGYWYFDLMGNGFGWDAPCPTCSVPLSGYGSGKPLVADFDGDRKADIAVQTSDSYWAVDVAADGFLGWNTPIYWAGWGGYPEQFAPGHFMSTTGSLDMGVKDSYGYWYVDQASNGWGSLDLALPTAHDLIDTNHAYIDSVTITTPARPSTCGDLTCQFGAGLENCENCSQDCGFCSGTINGGNFHETQQDPTKLKIGVRYTANVHLQPSTHCSGSVDDDSDGFPNDGCPYAGNAEDAGGCYNTIDDDGDNYVNDGCAAVGAAEVLCADTIDNDNDGFVNDGCGSVSFPESAGLCRNMSDDDNDGVVNDGCPIVGVPEADPGSVRLNPALNVPASLNVENVGGHALQLTASPVEFAHTRRFAFTCSQFGQFPLGFMFSEVNTSDATNVDYGQQVVCTADYPGIYGRITNKRTTAAILSGSSPTVKVNGVAYPVTNGFWNASGLTGGPYTIEITANGYAPTTVINVTVPPYGSPAGIEVDTPLEESFLLQAGITYKTYIDYSRGRTIFHTVRVDTTQAPITIGKMPTEIVSTVPMFKTLLDTAASQGAPAMINGIWWMGNYPNSVAKLTTDAVDDDGDGRINDGCPALGAAETQCADAVDNDGDGWVNDGCPTVGAANEAACNYTCEDRPGAPDDSTWPIGYLYLNGFVGPGVTTAGVSRPSDPQCASSKFYAAPTANHAAGAPPLLEAAWEIPMFTVKGTGTNQRVSIIMTDANFLTSNNGWKRVANVPNCPAGTLCPIYDAASPFNSSDYNYAMQMGHILLRNGNVIARGVVAEIGSAFPGEIAFAQTTIGVNSTGTVAWFVISDGEGIDGGNGATFNQIGAFYRDVLGASSAMYVDSGESTQMVLRGVNRTHRRVNTLTSENHAADGRGDYSPNGRVFAYIKAGM